MKRILDYKILIPIIGAIIVFVLFNLNDEGFSSSTTPVSINSLEKNVQQGERFILNWLVNPNGTLKTNLIESESTSTDIAIGTESLSESLGLWMLYTIEKNDLEQFNQAYSLLKQYYLSNKGIVFWKISYSGKNEVSTNALIDDFRIIEALVKAAEIWGVEDYIKTARTISKSLKNKQLYNNQFTDFYDIKSNFRNKNITLSYLNTAALESIYELEVIDEEIYETTKQFLRNIPNTESFYPKFFNIKTKTYHFDEQINLIDQVYIAYHQARMGFINKEFYSFIKAEFNKHGVIFGMYDRTTKTPIVNYESPALYGLTILYAIEANDIEFAKQLYYQMIQHQTLNPDKQYYGGFVDYSKNDTHIFDNLLPLLAERKLFNEGILQ